MNADKGTPRASAVSLLTLGTAQLGMPYGIANHQGQPDELQAERILNAALEGGITCFDTAGAYGSSEQVLGNYFIKQEQPTTIITKLFLPGDQLLTLAELELQIEESINRSMARLQTNCIPAMLLHRPNLLGMYGKAGTDLLRKQVNRGNIGRIGVSLTSFEEQEFAETWPELQDDFYEIVQVPINVLDRRMFKNGTYNQLRDSNKLLFARSIYLQGLLFIQPEELPAHLKAAEPWLNHLRVYAGHERMTVPELAFAYIHHMPGISSIVFGAETPEQVRANIELLDIPAISEKTLQEMALIFNNVPDFVITPAKWEGK